MKQRSQNTTSGFTITISPLIRDSNPFSNSLSASMRSKDASDLSTRSSSKVDVLIIGGGVTGIALATLLARNSKSMLLLENRDFASGTSQASGMMVWGGLLYLKNFEFRLVWKFCRARDKMIRRLDGEVRKRKFTYIGLKKGGRNRLLVWLALKLYQAFSLWKRAPLKPFLPQHMDPSFDASLFASGWTFEEGFLSESDSRYVLQQLLAENRNVQASNYHEITAIRSHVEGGFEVEYQDILSGQKMQTLARKVVNCGGVWAEEINSKFKITTKHTHYLSKGVYLLLPTSEYSDALIMDMDGHDDTLCWVPWGDVVMWGPTESKINSLDEAVATADDVDFLLNNLNRFSRKVWKLDDIVNVRCGVRPLVSKPHTDVKYPLDLSRRSVVEKSPEIEWWTVFGGKLSGAADLANKIHHTIFQEYPTASNIPPPASAPPMTNEFFDGRALPKPIYCRESEHCRTLEDYLRRRTNLAQWIPNSGFGKDFEFYDDLLAIATILTKDFNSALHEVQSYRAKIIAEKQQWYER